MKHGGFRALWLTDIVLQADLMVADSGMDLADETNVIPVILDAARKVLDPSGAGWGTDSPAWLIQDLTAKLSQPIITLPTVMTEVLRNPADLRGIVLRRWPTQLLSDRRLGQPLSPERDARIQLKALLWQVAHITVATDSWVSSGDK